MSHAQPEPTAPKTFGHKILVVVWWIILLWFVLLIPSGFISFSAGVPKDLRWATCHVTDATAEETNDDEQPWRLVIEATNCPTLVYTDGVTHDNAQQLADTFERAPYEVRVHKSAIAPEGYVRYAEELAIHSYRPAPENHS